MSNALVAWINGSSQRKLEQTKYFSTQRLEESKAEASRILEALKTGDPDVAAQNLELLIKTKLVSDEDGAINKYVKERKQGEGARLPAPSNTASRSVDSVNLPEVLKMLPIEWNSVLVARKPITLMTEQEIAKFRRSVKRLKTLKENELKSFETLSKITVYYGQFGNELFLPWNRVFLRYIEIALQEIEPEVVIPYWDWRDNPTVPTIFAEKTLKNGQRNPLWEFSRRTTISDIQSMFPDSNIDPSRLDFHRFSSLIENQHNILHGSLGGKMASINSSIHDPINLAVMAALDNLWYEWEKQNQMPKLKFHDQKLKPFSFTAHEVFLTRDFSAISQLSERPNKKGPHPNLK